MTYDHRLVQTATLGGRRSDEPVFLPMERHLALSFRDRHQDATFWCGELLGGCGGQVGVENYLDFLAARRELLADVADSFLSELASGSDSTAEAVEPLRPVVVVAGEPDDARSMQVREMVDSLLGFVNRRGQDAAGESAEEARTQPEFSPLFTEEELNRARTRLEQFGHRFPDA
ncbi:hypothetical protein ACIRPH_28350 [Nocardiopsis sp. NPDC101807]|uniref:hypothetical protein n=1 Tax=Nocardiopsis sp. NPDC101807 TaxID=3364339 RepID=UPI0037F73F4B